MNWLQKIASDEFYENMVFSALQKQNLLPAVDALKEHGLRGMDLWVKFKNEFNQDPRLLSDWILKTTAPVVPRYEAMDEIDEWAAKARGLRGRGTGRAPGVNPAVLPNSGGVGTTKGRGNNQSPPPEYRKYYRHS